MLYRKYIKRPMDIILSLLAIIVLSPLLIIIAILVKINLGSPILFKQQRPGLHEKLFTLYKFRTMTDRKDEQGNLLPDEVRLTKFGKMLRSTSLDELPELWNVLKGDMSIVGPRPLAIQYLPYYSSEERIRHSVRPGLTGYAQINGRNSVIWETRFQYDSEYVQQLNFYFDVQIIFKTIMKVFDRSDIGIRGISSPVDFDEYRKMQRSKERK